MTNISALHRLSSAEAWHFYLGRPLTISEILPDGYLKETLLGNDLLAGQTPQYIVQPGVWFGARVAEPTGNGSPAELQQVPTVLACRTAYDCHLQSHAPMLSW